MGTLQRFFSYFVEILEKGHFSTTFCHIPLGPFEFEIILKSLHALMFNRNMNYMYVFTLDDVNVNDIIKVKTDFCNLNHIKTEQSTTIPTHQLSQFSIENQFLGLHCKMIWCAVRSSSPALPTLYHFLLMALKISSVEHWEEAHHGQNSLCYL